MSNPFHQNYTCTITEFSESVSWGEVTTSDVEVYTAIPCQRYSNTNEKYKQNTVALDYQMVKAEVVLASTYTSVSVGQKIVVSDGATDLGTYKISFVRPGKKPN